MPLTSFGHSASYRYIDEALRSRWRQFRALEDEMDSFVPKPYEEYIPQRNAEIERLRLLNPEQTLEELTAYVDQQIGYFSSEWWQFQAKFDERHMSEYITVTLLSHALSEALANAVLAIGLANAGIPEVFTVLERSDIKEKWLLGPKAFAPGYEFPVGGGLHETLNMLAKQRNAFVHYKIDLSVDNQRVLTGTKVIRHGIDRERRWIRRCFSLPYDLTELAHRSLPRVPHMLLFPRSPVEKVTEHGA